MQLLEIYYGREIPTALKTHYALWCHKYDICILFTAKFLTKEAKWWTSVKEVTNPFYVNFPPILRKCYSWQYLRTSFPTPGNMINHCWETLFQQQCFLLLQIRLCVMNFQNVSSIMSAFKNCPQVHHCIVRCWKFILQSWNIFYLPFTLSPYFVT